MVTRFNNNTWQENVNWREKNQYSGCIYNSPIHIKELIPLELILYVIEMNNETNKILGFGRIINKVCTDQNYRIYDNRNYNRFTYKGKKRLDIKNLKRENSIKIDRLEEKLFKSKGHFKRGQGISQLPLNISKEYFNFVENLFNTGVGTAPYTRVYMAVPVLKIISSSPDPGITNG